MSREKKVEEILRPTVEDMGFIWWGVEYHHNSVNSILRVFIDKDGGICLDDIVAATEKLNVILDVENPIESSYTFEVSSPGLDRPLLIPEHYLNYVGEKIRLLCKQSIDGQRKFTGILQDVDIEQNQIRISFPKAKEQISINISFNNIDKCRLEPEF